MKENRKAYASLCAAMLIFGTIGIFRRNIPFSSGLLAFSRGLLGSVFLLIFVALRRHRLGRIEKKQLALLIVSGAVIGVNWILLFEAYNYTTVAVATMCFYMQPTIVILLSPVLFREKLSVKKGLCALAAIIGMVFVSGVAEGAMPGAQDAKGIAFGLAAAVLYAAAVIMNKRIRVERRSYSFCPPRRCSSRICCSRRTFPRSCSIRARCSLCSSSALCTAVLLTHCTSET